MMIRAIFFDFDGTISDVRELVMRTLIETLNEFNYDTDENKIRKLLGVKMVQMLEMLNLGIDEKAKENIRKQFYRKIGSVIEKGKIRPCVSLKPLWEMKKDIPMFVISNSRRNFLKASIKALGIRGLFKRVYGAEDFDEKDGMLGNMIRKMALKSDEVIYVGDRFSDVEFAKRAGCVSVAIHNRCSFSTLDKILKVGPDFVVRDFYGLRRVVKKIR